MKTAFIAVFVLATIPVTAAWISGQNAAEKEAQPSAAEILDRAAIFQGGDKILENLENFSVAFKLMVFDPDKGRVTFDVERFFAYAGGEGTADGGEDSENEEGEDLMWTSKRLDDSSARPSVIVFDGLEAWRISEKGVLTIFTDQPSVYQTDIDNIMDDLRLTGQMLRFFFIRSVGDTIEDVNLQSPRQIDGTPVWILDGTASAWLGGETNTRVHLRISIHREKDVIHEVRITDLAEGGQKRTFRFDKYFRNSQGILVPCQIKIFSKDEERFDMQIAVQVETVREEDADGNEIKRRIPRIEFNVPVPEKYFEIHEPEEK